MRSLQGNRLDAGIEREDITLLIGKVRALALKMTDVRLARYDLDLKHYAILSALDGGSAHSQRELADYLNVVPRRIMGQLETLESRGLILRQTGEDRRSYSVGITDKGRAVLEQCREIVENAENEYLKPLSEEQVRELKASLLAIARPPSLDDLLEDGPLI